MLDLVALRDDLVHARLTRDGAGDRFLGGAIIVVLDLLVVGRFPMNEHADQAEQIVGFVLLVLFGVSRVARYALKKVEDKEDAFFVLLFGVMAVAAALASVVQLPGIVGAFLAGLALNEASQDKPAAEKLGFFARSLFIPVFFLVTGFLMIFGCLGWIIAARMEYWPEFPMWRLLGWLALSTVGGVTLVGSLL